MDISVSCVWRSYWMHEMANARLPGAPWSDVRCPMQMGHLSRESESRRQNGSTLARLSLDSARFRRRRAHRRVRAIVGRFHQQLGQRVAACARDLLQVLCWRQLACCFWCCALGAKRSGAAHVICWWSSVLVG